MLNVLKAIGAAVIAIVLLGDPVPGPTPGSVTPTLEAVAGPHDAGGLLIFLNLGPHDAGGLLES